MRIHRVIPTLILAAALAACGGGDSAEGANDANKGEGSREEGRATLGSETAQEQGTVVNDTAPHRPGTPSNP